MVILHTLTVEGAGRGRRYVGETASAKSGPPSLTPAPSAPCANPGVIRLSDHPTGGEQMTTLSTATCPNCKGRDSSGWPLGPCTVCGGRGHLDPDALRAQAFADLRAENSNLQAQIELVSAAVKRERRNVLPDSSDEALLDRIETALLAAPTGREEEGA